MNAKEREMVKWRWVFEM